MNEAGLGHATGIQTWTHPDELEALFDLASEVPHDGQIVELGSYLGAATCYLAAGSATKSARLFCIDTWQNETMPDGLRDTFTEFQQHTTSVTARLTIVRKPTREVLPAELPARIDLAFIDADHSYEAARADTALVAPRLAPDGLLALHDTTFFPGVARALGELLASGEWALAGHCRNLTWLRRASWDVPAEGAQPPVTAS